MSSNNAHRRFNNIQVLAIMSSEKVTSKMILLGKIEVSSLLSNDAMW